MERNKLGGHLAAAGAYAIFGFNIVFNKDIANSGAVSPMVLFTLRAVGATALFWLLSLFLPKEKVAGKDLLRMVLASFLGLFVPQLSFLFAIGLSTSIDCAVLGSLTPIYTMCFAFLFLGEPITLKKAGGVAVSLAGVLLLIFNSVHAPGAVDRTQPLGVVLLLVNGMSFAAYLGAFRPLISRYSVVTFMKWMFLFSMLLSLPHRHRDGPLHLAEGPGGGAGLRRRLPGQPLARSEKLGADRESRFSAIVLQRLTPSRATLTGERLRNGNSRPVGGQDIRSQSSVRRPSMRSKCLRLWVTRV